MKRRAAMTKWAGMISLVILGGNMNACALGGASWKEEVLLHDGTKLIADRSIERGGRHEIGQQPPVREETLGFTIPGTNDNVSWKSEYSENIGYADLAPLLVDVFLGTAYMVAVPVGCLSYNKWGRPNPPYIIFKYQRDAWNRITLSELPAEIRTPNLIFSSPDNEVKKLGKSLVTTSMIRHTNRDLTQPEYKTIVREAVKLGAGASAVNCEEMIPYGKTGWLGLDWFADQPSYEACLRFCEKKRVRPKHCPCDRIFGRK